MLRNLGYYQNKIFKLNYSPLLNHKTILPMRKYS